MRKGLLQEHAETLELVFRLADLGLIAIGGLAAYWLRFGDLQLEGPYQIAISLAVLIALFVYPAAGLYQPWRGAGLWQEVRRIAVAWLIVIAACVVIAYLTKTGQLFSRLWFGYWVLGVLFALTLARVVLRTTLRRLRERGYNTRNVAIVGATEKARELVKWIQAAPDTGMKIVGLFDEKTKGQAPGEDAGAHLAGDFSSLVDQAREGGIDMIYIALPMHAEKEIQDLIARLADTTASVYFAPDFRAVDFMQSRWTHLGPLPVVSVFETPFRGIDGWTKRLEDIVLASLILILISVPMLIIALVIRVTYGRPVLFVQDRYGLAGEPIKVLKFRTMHTCDNGQKIPQARKNDPRVTRFGAFLRRTSLDELPQFINVLKGDMSIVGPRPHAVAHNEEYRKRIRGYMLRHKVKPGITGWAQVNGWRGETDSLEKMEKRVEYDLWYIRNWSVWLDLRLILKTILVGFRDQSAY